MNPKDIDTGFLRRAASQINNISYELNLATQLLDAKERYRTLCEAVKNTKPGADRSIANEKRCEALAIVIDLQNKLEMMEC